MPTPEQDPRVYYAAERTLLAWVRTGLAMMGFGFVVARFGILIAELTTQSPTATTLGHKVTSHGVSLWFGTGLILLGVLVHAGSVWQYQHEVSRLRRGEPFEPRVNRAAVTLILLLAAIGIAVAVHLVNINISLTAEGP